MMILPERITRIGMYPVFLFVLVLLGISLCNLRSNRTQRRRERVESPVRALEALHVRGAHRLGHEVVQHHGHVEGRGRRGQPRTLMKYVWQLAAQLSQPPQLLLVGLQASDIMSN